MTSYSKTLAALENAFQTRDLVRHAQVLCRLIRSNHLSLMEITAAHPLQDAWLDFSYQSLAKYFEKTRGYVYVAVNDARPDWLKVGKTTNLSRRVAQLNHAGILGLTRIVFYHETRDRHWLELKTHRILQEMGFERQKEFFRAPLVQVQNIITGLEETDKLKFHSAGYYG